MARHSTAVPAKDMPNVEPMHPFEPEPLPPPRNGAIGVLVACAVLLLAPSLLVWFVRLTALGLQCAPGPGLCRGQALGGGLRDALDLAWIVGANPLIAIGIAFVGGVAGLIAHRPLSMRPQPSRAADGRVRAADLRGMGLALRRLPDQRVWLSVTAHLVGRADGHGLPPGRPRAGHDLRHRPLQLRPRPHGRRHRLPVLQTDGRVRFLRSAREEKD